MADIFNEVDEEVRRERLKQLWDRYGIFVIALAVLVVIGIGGWRGYEWYQAKKSAAAGAEFEQAVALSEKGKQKEAEAAFAKIAKEAPSGYQTLARFRAAAGLVKNNPAEAAKAYDALATDPTISPTLQDLATVRAALLQVDTASFGDLERKLTPVAAAGRPFHATARELLALSAWGHHDYKQARHYIDLLMGDPETSQAMRGRVQILAALIAGTAKPSEKPAAKPAAAPGAKSSGTSGDKPAAKPDGKS
ncbi:MAG: tetratricopeptide repeat protein [Pseudolabrys sp.]